MSQTEITIVTKNQEVKIKVSKIVNIKSEKDFIYFDKMPDGTYRMAYTNNILKDIK